MQNVAAVGQRRDLLFISYSHEQSDWRNQLLVFLKPWVRAGRFEVWADTYIATGDRWYRDIKLALGRARIGVLLVSQDFLASDFIVEEELPELLGAADRGELTLVCVPISAVALFPPLPEARLLEFQWPRPPDQPLDQLDKAHQDRAWAEITTLLVTAAGIVADLATDQKPAAPRARTAAPLEVSSDARSMGELHGVPAQRPHYVDRTVDVKRIKTALLGANGAVGITGSAQRVGLHGRGGIGKSVLAIAVVSDPEIRQFFPDGVYWLSIGQRPDLVGLQSELARALGGLDEVIADVRQGLLLLRRLWGERRALLMLDDLWAVEHAAALDVANPDSRVLLTSRDGSLVTALGAHEEPINILDPDAARSLLALWVGKDSPSLPPEAESVAAESGYVPLALSVAGALVRDGVSWGDILEALRAGKLRFLEHPSGSVFASMRLSVDFLAPEVRARYVELAVFPEDTDIPESTVCQLWLRSGALADFEARRVLRELARKGLLYLEQGTSAEVSVSFHDLQHDFLRLIAEDLMSLHGQLVDAFLVDGSSARGGTPSDD